MMALQVRDLTKEYESTPVLTGVSFDLAVGERVGLVGANGCGKSTLMKILAGELQADGGGLLWVTEGLSRAYMSQAGHWDESRPLGEQLNNVPEELLARCGVTAAMLKQRAGTLSGGQKTRAALARVLAGRPHVLLLDEPTNHLDTEGLQWLESLLASYRGAVLVVSHDRYFLDQTATRILEMKAGTVAEYPGNYSAYQRQKQAEAEKAQADYRQYVKEKKHLEAAIRRQRQWALSAQNAEIPFGAPMNAKGYNASQGKAHFQVAGSMEKRLEKIRVEKPRDAAKVNLRFDGADRLGKNLVLAERLGFSYDGQRWLMRGADFYVQRGDRVAITGPNGSGKSTLVKLLLGQLTPTEGSLYRSPLRVGYLEQELASLNPELTVLQEASGGNSAMDQADVRTLLGCLLFSGEEVLKKVGVLSGGEKLRLALAKLLLSSPEMLILDEPTNGLDLPSRERVEEALEGYPGTLILVSHDRYLLKRLTNRVLKLEIGRIIEPSAQPARESKADQRLVLETRLAQLSAALAAPPPGEAERLTAEFINLSRELRNLQ